MRVYVTAAKPLRRIAIAVPKGTGRRELDEELRDFLEMAAEEKMKQGMSRKDALGAVRLERGSLEITEEVVRSAGWESLVGTLWQDLRFAARKSLVHGGRPSRARHRREHRHLQRGTEKLVGALATMFPGGLQDGIERALISVTLLLLQPPRQRILSGFSIPEFSTAFPLVFREFVIRCESFA